jgi:hypothetical protein
LTEDDLSTIRTLYDAGIRASVLLSKSDLLAPEDRLKSLDYVSEQIRSRLGLTPSVYPVSIQASHTALLETWLEEVILPLYERHQQLMEESLRRKIGSLREAVETALTTRLDRAHGGDRRNLAAEPADPDKIDGDLRKAVGRISEVREFCFEITHKVRDYPEQAIAEAAEKATRASPGGGSVPPSTIVHDVLVQSAAESADLVFRALKDVARELVQTLNSAAQALGFNDVHKEDDFASAIKEMPRLDLGALQVHLHPNLLSKLSTRMAIRHAEHSLNDQIGPAVGEAFSNFGSLLGAWARRTLTEIQLRFENHADAYRAHLDRMKTRGHVSSIELEAMTQALDLLSGRTSEAKEEMTPAP